MEQKAMEQKKINPQKIGTFMLNNALYFILGLILVVVISIRPNFASLTNIINIIKQSSTKGIMALGLAGLIVFAGTDLSAGRVLGFAGAVTASLVQSVTYASRYYPNMTEQLPLIVPLLAAILVAVVFTRRKRSALDSHILPHLPFVRTARGRIGEPQRIYRVAGLKNRQRSCLRVDGYNGGCAYDVPVNRNERWSTDRDRRHQYAGNLHLMLLCYHKSSLLIESAEQFPAPRRL